MAAENTNNDGIDVKAALQEAFVKLPKVVQDAILSADVEKQMRALAETHKLHVDQWSALENEVMLTLLGLQAITDLQTNLINEVGVPAEEAASLATDISKIVFDPIRQELERELEHPDAKGPTVSAEETARTEMLAQEAAPGGGEASVVTPPPAQPQAPGVLPATPPAPKPTEKAVRAPVSSSYLAQQASSERKSIEGDPYRELPL
jgi:hypothetical protein